MNKIMKKNMKRIMKKILGITLLLALASPMAFTAFARAETPAKAPGTTVIPADEQTSSQEYYQFMCELAKMIIQYGEWETWPDEQKAALDQIKLGLNLDDIKYPIPSTPAPSTPAPPIPGAEDVSQEEALRIAMECIAEEYSEYIQPDLETWAVESYFSKWPGEDGTFGGEWDLVFTKPLIPEERYYAYIIKIGSPNREILSHQLEIGFAPPEDTPEDTPDETLREGEITLEEAVQVAREIAFYVAVERGKVPAEVFDGFAVSFASLGDGYRDGRAWNVDLAFPDEAVSDYFGSYRLRLASDSGRVLMIQHQGGTRINVD